MPPLSALSAPAPPSEGCPEASRSRGRSQARSRSRLRSPAGRPWGAITAEQLRSAVQYGGFFYATLDFTEPQVGVVGTQREFLELPLGWELAPDEPDVVEHVIAKHPWSTDCLVVRNGNAYWTTNGNPQGGQFDESNLLLSEGGDRYKPRESDFRVLIRTSGPQWTPSRHCSALAPEMWSQRRFTDCVVMCGTESVRCHRAVLSVGSQVFERMLSSGMREAVEQQIQITDAEPSVVHAMLAFIYTGEITVGNSGLGHLLAIADRYEVKALMAACALKIYSCIDVDNVAALIRALRGLMELPEVRPTWDLLMQRLHDDRGLMCAAITGLSL